MVGALGVNQKLFTSVFFVGSVLAGLGGALQIPREPANLAHRPCRHRRRLRRHRGGRAGQHRRRVPRRDDHRRRQGLLHRHRHRELIGVVLSFSKLTLVVEFLVMAVVLVVRPYGLLGRPQAAAAPRRRSRAAARRAALDVRRWSAWRCCSPCRSSPTATHHPADRHPLLRAVRRQPALHHGPGRHGLVRSRRLFRPRRLCRRPAAQARRPADGGRAAAGAADRRRLRPGLRLVLRPARPASTSRC